MKQIFPTVSGLVACAWVTFFPTESFAGVGLASTPVRVILDTDLATDCDDAGAVAMLHTLADTGEAEILAMGVSLLNDHSVLALDAINTFFMRPNIPIGTTKAADAYDPPDRRVRYVRRLSEEYPRSHTDWESSADAPDVVAVYRGVLAGEPDIDDGNPGVVMVSIGMLTNFRDLLQSEPDSHSALNGRELVERKVRLWVCMGGRFPSGREYNVHQHAAASRYALENWPSPIVFSGFEIGHRIITGPAMLPLPSGPGPDGHIIRRAYELHRSLEGGRHSWDQAAVLYAVRGIDGGTAANHWTLSSPGRIQLASDGSNSWMTDEEGWQRYKIERRNPDLIANEIESLMISGKTVMAGLSSAWERSAPREEPVLRPYHANPWYWQYKEKPILLLGGSWQHNLFNHPVHLEEHLDVLREAGGNYIRNTMTSRNDGNVWPFAKTGQGSYDLDQWNDEYWQRLDRFLEMTYERDIIVQIEVWDRWDYFRDRGTQGGWAFQPFNPINNVNYTAEESGLPEEINYNPGRNPTNHSFFQTVPAMSDLSIARRYQEKFVDKLLSVTLHYPHVLYCISNETSERYPWSDYWATYIHDRAGQAGRTVYVTEMRREDDPAAPTHRRIQSMPEVYNFLDISQTTAYNGQEHWDMIQLARSLIADNPRPINQVKIYGGGGQSGMGWAGSAEEASQRLWRIAFGGSAGGRFHRPYPIQSSDDRYLAYGAGLGLSPLAQAQIRGIRMITDEMKFFRCEPRNDLLSNRQEGEAFCMAEPGAQYAVYFPRAGEISLDLSGADHEFEVRWLDVSKSEWTNRSVLTGGGTIQLATPNDEAWAVLLLRRD